MSIAKGLRLLFPSKQYQVQQTNVLEQKDIFVQVCIETLCSHAVYRIKLFRRATRKPPDWVSVNR